MAKRRFSRSLANSHKEIAEIKQMIGGANARVDIVANAVDDVKTGQEKPERKTGQKTKPRK